MFSPAAGEDDQHTLLSSKADICFHFPKCIRICILYRNQLLCNVRTEKVFFSASCHKFRLVKLQSRNASASIMNFFPSCYWQANIILLVTSFTSPSDYVLFSTSHVYRQLAILVADFFSSHVLYFARAESSISTKWSANCKETKGLWGSRTGFSGSGICLIWRPGFAIQNQNEGENWDWTYTRDAESRKNHRDHYGIARNLVRDYGIEEPDWGPPNLIHSIKNSRGLGKSDHSR